MEIKYKGNHTNNIIFNATCRHCNCKFDFYGYEGYNLGKLFGRYFKNKSCPNCGETVNGVSAPTNFMEAHPFLFLSLVLISFPVLIFILSSF